MNQSDDRTTGLAPLLEPSRGACPRRRQGGNNRRQFVDAPPFGLGATEGPDVANSVRISPHGDRLFQRVCRTVEKNFTDPRIGPADIAADVGISLRYLQKLFTRRGTTCGQYTQFLRLGHAYTLLAGATEVKGGQSISEIAWASGYRDRSYFHRVFRQRFGRSPGSCRRQHEAIRHEGSW